MDDSTGKLALLIGTIIIAVVALIQFYLIFYYLVIGPLIERFTYLRYKWFQKPIKPTYKALLIKHFPYYNRLTRTSKKQFEHRLMVFLSAKRFKEKGHVKLTLKQKVLIAASAIQLTLGLRYFRLRSFYHIYVYPDSYQHKGYKHKFKGHFGKGGTLHLSWKHFEAGYADPSDGLNLGLHEMAHALLEDKVIEDIDYDFYENYEVWEELAKIELKRIRKKENRFFRNYAGRNLFELFAVSVEYFFEVPEQFKERLPEFYDKMVKLLKQDPTKKDPLMIDRVDD